MKVAMLGAAGGIGQPMALLMKLNPLISHLALYDIVHTPGVAADVSHCATPAQVSGHLGPQQLKDALEGSQVVTIPAGVPRKPGYELAFALTKPLQMKTENWFAVWIFFCNKPFLISVFTRTTLC